MASSTLISHDIDIYDRCGNFLIGYRKNEKRVLSLITKQVAVLAQSNDVRGPAAGTPLEDGSEKKGLIRKRYEPHHSTGYGYFDDHPLHRLRPKSSSGLSTKNKKVKTVLPEICNTLSKITRQHWPQIAEKHSQFIKSVESSLNTQGYRFTTNPDCIFSNFIVNNHMIEAGGSGKVIKQSLAKYHQDKPNKNSYAALIVNSDNIKEGGCLHFYHLGLTFDMKNGSVMVFDGKKLYHAVTDVTLEDRYMMARRTSVVGFLGPVGKAGS